MNAKTIAVQVSAVVLFFFLFSFPVQAIPSECLGATFYSSYTIDNTGNSNTLTNYQVFLNLTRETHMPVDASQGLCFAVGSTETYAPYWLQYNDSNYIEVWINANSIPASSEIGVKVYYNTSQSSSATVFEFGDDFEYGNQNDFITSGGWTLDNGHVGSFTFYKDTEGTWMEADAGTGSGWHASLAYKDIFTTLSETDDYIFEQRVRVTSNPSGTSNDYVELQNSTGSRESRMTEYDSQADTPQGELRAYSPTQTIYTSNGYDTYGPGITKIIKVGSTYKYYIDDVQKGSTITDNPLNPTRVYLYWGSRYNSYNRKDHELDWIRLRKYTNPEPSSYKTSGEQQSFGMSYIVSNYVLYTNLSSSTEVSEMKIIAENSHNNNLTVNMSEYLIPATTYNYSYNTSIFNLGFGNFTVEYYDTNSSQLPYFDTIMITDEVPMTITLKDVMTSDVLPNTNFTYKAPDANGTVITTTSSTDNNGRRAITVKRFYDYSTITITVANLGGYYDKTYSTSVGVDKNITIYIEPLSASTVQVIITVVDAALYQPLTGVTVDSNYTGQKTTDSFGKVSFLGIAGQVLDLTFSKTGYEDKSATLEMYTRYETIYLTPLIVSQTHPVSVEFDPSRIFLNTNTTYIPMVTLSNYDRVSSITFVIAKSRTFYEYYQLTKEEQTGVVDAETFDMQDLSWCTSTWLCAYNSEKITFRYSQQTINAFADNPIIVYNYTTDEGNSETGQMGYMFSTLGIDLANIFTDSQKPWVGFGIVLFGTFSVAASLIKHGYNPTTRQLGFIAWFLLIIAYVFGFFTWPYIVIGSMVFWGTVIGGKLI